MYKMVQIKFIEACQLWEEDKARYVKASTMAAYSLIVRNHLAPHFQYLGDISPASVQGLVDKEIESGRSMATVKGIVIVLGMVIRFCEKQGWMENRTYEPRFPARQGKYHPQILPVKEEMIFLEYLEGHPSKLNAGLLLCACAGLRIGEVCALKWGDVDFADRTIHVRRTVYRIYTPGREPRKSFLAVGLPKTPESCRDVPLTESLTSILMQLHDDRDDDAFVLSGEGRPAEPQTFRNNFNRVLDELGLPRRKVHSLRHTFATRCVESQCDFKTLSTILGHANVSTTLNLYVHPGIEQKRRCIENMLKGLER